MSRVFFPINQWILLKFEKLLFIRNLRFLLMSVGTSSFFISSTVQELWVFENSLKSAKNAKNINFSEILKICKVQIKEFYLILINKFYKTSEILDF